MCYNSNDIKAVHSVLHREKIKKETTMNLQRLCAAALTLTLALPFISGSGTAAADAASSDEPVTLFALNSAYTDYLSIPDSFPTSFQLDNSGGNIVDCRVISGESVTVTNSGLIEPAYETWYWNGGAGSTISWGVEGEIIEKRPFIGDSVVEVTTDSGLYCMNVSVLEYGEYYADKVISDYAADNITDSMTPMEKLEAVVKLPASYDYSPTASSYVSMIVRKGGDCWGSCAVILEELEILGINGWIRNGNRDVGASSGHRNVLAEVDGEYYELEAGYVGSAPRLCHVTKRDSLFNFRNIDGGYEIYQYDGTDTEQKILEIPSEYNGVPVIGLAEEAFSGISWVEEIALPESLTSIGDFAFYNMSSLRKVTIPESLSSIGGGAFIYCDSLQEFDINENNSHFASDGKALYNKDFSELVYIPAASEDYAIPESVEVIREQAGRYDRNRTHVTVPSNVKIIGEGAFHGCTKLESVTLEEGIEEIGNFAFAANNKLKSVTVPDSVTSIGESAFGINIYGNVIEDFVLYGSEGSAAQRYAQDNGIRFEIAANNTPEAAYGDSNCDNLINIADSVLIMQYLANPAKYGPDTENGITAQGLLNADVSGNSNGVTGMDALSIQQFLLGLINSLPVS